MLLPLIVKMETRSHCSYLFELRFFDAREGGSYDPVWQTSWQTNTNTVHGALCTAALRGAAWRFCLPIKTAEEQTKNLPPVWDWGLTNNTTCCDCDALWCHVDAHATGGQDLYHDPGNTSEAVLGFMWNKAEPWNCERVRDFSLPRSSERYWGAWWRSWRRTHCFLDLVGRTLLQRHSFTIVTWPRATPIQRDHRMASPHLCLNTAMRTTLQLEVTANIQTRNLRNLCSCCILGYTRQAQPSYKPQLETCMFANHPHGNETILPI